MLFRGKTREQENPVARSLEESLKEAERSTNMLVSWILLATGVYGLVMWLLSCIGYYGMSQPTVSAALWVVFLVNSVVFLYEYLTDGRKKWSKTLLMVCTCFTIALLNLVHSDVLAGYAILVFVTSGYSDTRYSLILSAVFCVLLLVCTYIAEYYYFLDGIADPWLVDFPEEVEIRYLGFHALNLTEYMTAREYALCVMTSRVPINLVTLLISSLCSILIANNNRRILESQHETDKHRAEADRHWAEAEAELNRNRTMLLESNSRLLVSQIQPHFIFNVLNSIYHLCKMDPDLAQSAVADFSDYMRNNLNALKTDEAVPFSVELNHIETYLRLEKMRFGKRLRVEWDIEAENFMLPALSVQPLVENAVKHGICRRNSGGTLKISSMEIEDGYLILICDDGVGFDTEAELDDSHVGLRNVRSRLEIVSGAKMDVQSTPGAGTVVSIVFPKEENHADSGV